ncbi:MAG: M23 family metallopeptidase [Erythrobacter sp.]|jgi:murein DD-endopeptidase MepM/ murein hydrolase activator NlpD|uniref:M23 family metallopeptidase n=1 Tax=Qipengyuania TaxID=1855416 RepID=UPI001A4FBDD5|nr:MULTISPECIES: M23 family metallopeptidase [Qipengyuania]MBL4719380.1 M23 family metallopeptidase [Erythrobacter sp.]MCP2018203.1 murein DD-endopeptidase MepM/ murein hydrolase activator NlpD [Qipengyuania citrea]MDE0901863.1 M23 family metallopeptidase [Erythrobacter sp.]WPL57475.1 M23 family metallopeptidase [Qipengyuania sp. HL-TH5]|tara:strand:+ start:42165 stop:42842 length:678 start_codon:yes stop_codon:yes gene_type:complete
MITKRTSLVLALMAGFGIAAAPAHAQETNAAAAVGAIDMSKVTAPAQAGDDAQFQQLFAKWDELDRTTPAAARVSVPSRMPLDDTRLTSDYGMRTHPVLGGRRSHKGVDLSAPTGTPIYATADGYISKAEWFSSYGKYVSIEHGANLQTRFAHMSDIAVTAGSRVKKGDIIGYVGSTGRSTGPHLHYEVRIDGKAVNPVPYMVESEAQRAFALATGQGGQGDGEE